MIYLQWANKLCVQIHSWTQDSTVKMRLWKREVKKDSEAIHSFLCPGKLDSGRHNTDQFGENSSWLLLCNNTLRFQNEHSACMPLQAGWCIMHECAADMMKSSWNTQNENSLPVWYCTKWYLNFCCRIVTCCLPFDKPSNPTCFTFLKILSQCKPASLFSFHTFSKHWWSNKGLTYSLTAGVFGGHVEVDHILAHNDVWNPITIISNLTWPQRS